MQKQANMVMQPAFPNKRFANPLNLVRANTQRAQQCAEERSLGREIVREITLEIVNLEILTECLTYRDYGFMILMLPLLTMMMMMMMMMMMVMMKQDIDI